MELAATSGSRDMTLAGGFGPPVGMGALQLQGRLADGVQWTLGGLMSENEGRAWRVAAEFVLEPGGGHELEVGAGYGAGDGRAALVGDAARARPRARGGVRAGPLAARRARDRDDRRALHLPRLPGGRPPRRRGGAGRVQGDLDSVVHGSVSTRTLAPGGDLLTLSTVAASPAITWARLEEGLRPARSLHYEVGVDRTLGPGAHVGAQLFAEQTRTTPCSRCSRAAYRSSATPARSTRAASESPSATASAASSTARVTYTFGQGRRAGRADPRTRRADHRLRQGRVPRSGGAGRDLHRLVGHAARRALPAERAQPTTARRPRAARGRRTTSARFDIQLTQGLPFLAPLTRADWEVLVAVRNMFYEASQAGFLDELAVQDPPTRVVGGISVRF